VTIEHLSRTTIVLRFYFSRRQNKITFNIQLCAQCKLNIGAYIKKNLFFHYLYGYGFFVGTIQDKITVNRNTRWRARIHSQSTDLQTGQTQLWPIVYTYICIMYILYIIHIHVYLCVLMMRCIQGDPFNCDHYCNSFPSQLLCFWRK